MKFTELRRQVLDLSSDDRRSLVHDLIGSLESDGATDAGLLASHLREVESRLAAHRGGEIAVVPHDQMMVRLREDLGKLRR